jgi:glucose-6-phosphate 1-epimerase
MTPPIAATASPLATAAATAAAVAAIDWHGQRCHALQLGHGDRVVVAEHGGQVLSWQTGDGREQLYLSPRSVWDGHTAIRGGVPVCFPQFNLRGPLPKHGFARNRPWQLASCHADDADHAELVMALQHDAHTLSLWPHAFALELRVSLRPNALRLTLSVTNTGTQAFTFTGALHTYLAVEDIAQAALQGLTPQPLRFTHEVDQPFDAAPQPLTLTDGHRHLVCTQSASWPEHVVWNPGRDKSVEIDDLPDDGYRHMLCIEAAAVTHVQTVMPGACWVGWQSLQRMERP